MNFILSEVFVNEMAQKSAPPPEYRAGALIFQRFCGFIYEFAYTFWHGISLHFPVKSFIFASHAYRKIEKRKRQFVVCLACVVIPCEQI
jgi:hypothetical protein